MTNENDEIKNEMGDVIDDLEKKGINFNTREEDYTGLGDVLENLTDFWHHGGTIQVLVRPEGM